MSKLSEIEGIGPVCAAKLEAAGVKNQAELLAAGGTPKGRKELAAKCELSDKLVLKWINRADLARVKGIGEEYADLLEHSGVDSVPELAQRRPDNLYKKMVEVNEAKKLVRALPSESTVAKWVEQAKTLPRAVSH
jgi:predicted flap endonuclease-1-like 5' DNA nuclease